MIKKKYLNKSAAFSYWEVSSWFKNIDFTIVGSGIVGLFTSLFLREKYPKATILIIEKGFLPEGASTKNAGFACFGSLSEILEDLKTHTEEEVLSLVSKRNQGLHLMMHTLSKKAIDFKPYGGYELFLKNKKFAYEEAMSKIKTVNDLLYPLFEKNVFSKVPDPFSFKKLKGKLIFNPFEGQINTGKMMISLLNKAYKKGIRIVNNCTLKSFQENEGKVALRTNLIHFSTSKLLLTTNGFSHLLSIPKVRPARAQVLITKPIKNLHIKGTFHLDRGYYYFRNIDRRILLGGGRNLDFKGEETTDFSQTELIQNRLKKLLRDTILPNTPYEIDMSWSGIMGIGKNKLPEVKQISNHVYCGVKMGGMGVALGSLTGKELANML